MCVNKTISSGHARALLSLPSTEAMLEQLALIKENNLSVRETEKNISELKQNSDNPDKKPYNHRKLAKELSSLTNLKVAITGTKDKGFIKISYNKKDQFDQVINHVKQLSLPF